jgi:hypothetical protein
MDGNLVNGVMRLFGKNYNVRGMFNFVDGISKDNFST